MMTVVQGRTAEHICLRCQVAGMPELLTLEEADAQIAEIQELRASLERLLARAGPAGGAAVPPAGEALASTPAKALEAVHALLRNALQDRENILAACKPAAEDDQRPSSGN